MNRLPDPDGLAPNASKGLADILAHPRFEVLPTPGVEARVFQSLKPGTIVHVMCPPEQGADHSVDVTVRIAGGGYSAVPHIAARTVASRDHLQELLEKMHEGGIHSGFFPGGDGDPVGRYESAVELLDDLATMEHGLSDIGIGAYPQGHRVIPKPVLTEALLQKQNTATYMVSENCFEPQAIITWLREMRNAGVTLPLMVGVPGVVRVRRLLASCKQFGLQSAIRYLQNQHGMVRALLGSKFSPGPVVAAMASAVEDDTLGISGIHFYTFNEVSRTEDWYRKALAGISEPCAGDDLD